MSTPHPPPPPPPAAASGGALPPPTGAPLPPPDHAPTSDAASPSPPPDEVAPATDGAPLPPGAASLPPPAGAPLPPPFTATAPAPPSVPPSVPPASAPATSGSDGEARTTAALWVAAVGALLLLAAAGTFLAVQWHALGLPARIAVVAAVTVGAILGGHRLRAVLPAVGAVVLHLGALLVPVDALGLALQLGAPVAGRWMAVGATGVVVLPLLSVVARSRVLRWAAVACVPILATGIGLAGALAAPLVVAAGAVVLVLASLVAGRSAAARAAEGGVGSGVLGAAASALALVAVHVPPVAAVVDAAPGTGGISAQLAAAGWTPQDWRVVALTGVLAVAVLAVVAGRRRTPGGVALTLVTAGVAAVTALLPAGTPRLALLVGVPLLALLLEAAAAAVGRDRLWGGPTRAVALVLEILAAPLALVVLGALLDPSWTRAVANADAELAAGLTVAALAWAVAGGRRVRAPGAVRGVLPVLVGVGVCHLALAAVVGGLPVGVATLVLLGGVLASVVPTEPVLGAAGEADGALGPTAAPGAVGTPVTAAVAARRGRAAVASGAAAVALVLGAAAVATAAVAAAAVAAAALVTVVLALHVATALQHERPGGQVLAWTLLGPAVLLVLVAAGMHAPSLPGTPGTRVAALLVLVAGLALLGHAADRLPVAADVVRGVLLVVGLVALLPVGIAPTFSFGSNPVGAQAVVLTRVLPTALVPAVAVAIALAVAARTTGRSHLGAFAAAVAVRAVVAGTLAAGLTVTQAAAVVLVVAVLAGGALLVTPPRWHPALGTAAAVAAILGWLLVGDARLVRAVALLVVGLALVGVAALRRRAWVGHVGAALAVLGAWDLLGALEVTALDAWTAPLAAYAWVAGAAARRAGTLRSSWLVDAPAVLLVVVPALLERVAGGSGWHAVLAGGVALVAVVVGGTGRHAAPLVLGTVALVAVVLVETIAVLAVVPTWVWLAVGGAVLLGTAALIERTGGKPVRAARRLLDVVAERFD